MAATHFHPRTHATFESGAMAPVAGQKENTATTAEVTEAEVVRSKAARISLALVRYGFGFTFLWAFFDKLLALGYATGRADDGTVDRFGDAAWIHGGSPTEGFLKFGADGPFKDFYNNIAGAWWADVLFMAGLLGIGLALTLGIGMRFAAIAGAALYVLMWSVVLPPANNPVIDEHILGALTLVALALTNAGNTWGLGKVWTRTALVDRFRWLR